MDVYTLQAIENILVAILYLATIICSAMFSWWLLLLLLAIRPIKYVSRYGI
jgi:hypothetical protein